MVRFSLETLASSPLVSYSVRQRRTSQRCVWLCLYRHLRQGRFLDVGPPSRPSEFALASDESTRSANRLICAVLPSCFRGLAGGGYMAAATAQIRCKALPCAGAVRSCRLFPPDGSIGRAAALRRLLSADQSDLYRAGHGVGIFHIAPNPALETTGDGCFWAARWPCCGCFCARSSIDFSATMPLRAICGICIMCRRSLRRCSACSPRCSSGGGRAPRFPAGGICCSFRRRCSIGGVLTNDLHQTGVSRRAGRCDAASGLYPRLDVLPRHDVDCRAGPAGDRNYRLPQVPRV